MVSSNDAAAGAISRWSIDEVHTSDADQAIEEISAVFSPHRLEVVGGSRELSVNLRARRTESLTIADLSHGAEVVASPGELRSYYEINIPLIGHTHSSSGNYSIETDTETAAILGPNRESTMRWSADCVQIAVKVRRELIDATLERLLGYPPDEMAEFSLGLDLSTTSGLQWVAAVRMLRDSIDIGAPDFVLESLEELVLRQLLATATSNFSTRLQGNPRPARPRNITRVIDVIESEPGTPHTVTSLASVAGVSVRSLQAFFSEHLGITPMEYLRKVRLSRCRSAFQQAEPGDGQTVADIAFQHGFSHLPRFAAAYRKQYGESPSDTLRRR